jgi:hypothetical protein
MALISMFTGIHPVDSVGLGQDGKILMATTWIPQLFRLTLLRELLSKTAELFRRELLSELRHFMLTSKSFYNSRLKILL